MLPKMPRFTVEHVRRKLKTSFPSVNAAVKVFEDLGIGREFTGQKINRSYGYEAFFALLAR